MSNYCPLQHQQEFLNNYVLYFFLFCLFISFGLFVCFFIHVVGGRILQALGIIVQYHINYKYQYFSV